MNIQNLSRFNPVSRVEAIDTRSNERTIALSLLALLVLLALSYLYFVTSITVNVVGRKSAEAQYSDLRANVGQLELRYLAQTSSIDIDYARELGFIDAQGTHFATRGALATR